MATLHEASGDPRLAHTLLCRQAYRGLRPRIRRGSLAARLMEQGSKAQCHGQVERVRQLLGCSERCLHVVLGLVRIAQRPEGQSGEDVARYAGV